MLVFLRTQNGKLNRGDEVSSIDHNGHHCKARIVGIIEMKRVREQTAELNSKAESPLLFYAV